MSFTYRIMSVDIKVDREIQYLKHHEVNSTNKYHNNYCLSITSDLEHLEQGNRIFTSQYMVRDDNYVYIVDSAGKLSEHIFELSQENIQRNSYVRCQRGFDSQLLLSLVIMPFLRLVIPRSDDACFIHASGASLNGKAIISTAWANTGKTNTLIGLLTKGAKYIGDDLTLIKSNGYSIPFRVPLNIFDYNIRCHKKLRDQLSVSQSLKIKLSSVLSKFFISLSNKRSIVGKLSFFFKAGGLFFQNAAHVKLYPEQFGCESELDATPIDIFQLIERGEVRSIVNDLTVSETVSRISICLEYEFKEFNEYLLLYAWNTGRKISFFDTKLEKQILEKCISSVGVKHVIGKYN